MWAPRVLLLGLLLHCHHLNAEQGRAAAVPLTAVAEATAAAGPAAPSPKGGAGAGEAGGGSDVAAAAAAQLQRRRLTGAPNNGSVAAPAPCTPTLRAVARQQPGLRQLLALAHAGYDVFVVDPGKPFTLLAPTDAALQQLAAGIVDGDERLLLQDGFYSVVLYHQLPEGALDLGQLAGVQDADGVLTSLGRTLRKDRYSVTFDNSTDPVVATGGWPANNAPLISSHKACNGWLHVIDAVLLPTQRLSNLPRLVDALPDLPSASFWALLDGTALLTSNGSAAAEAPAPADAAATSPPPPAHSNGTGIVVSGGNGTEVGSDGLAAGGSASSSSSGSGDSKMLVVAASVAGGAVALCAAVVTGVLLRKRQLRRRRAAHSRLESQEEQEDDEDDEEGDHRGYDAKASARPVQVHVDA